MKARRIACILILTLACGVLLGGCRSSIAGDEHIRAGEAALEEDRIYDALKEFKYAARAQEDPIGTYRGMGVTYLSLEQPEEAAQALQQALDATDDKMPKTRMDIRLYLATALYQCGEYPDVISQCEKMLETESRPEICFLYGSSSLKMGDQETAKLYFDRAVSFDPEDYEMYLMIYKVYEEENLTGVGYTYLDEALKHPAETAQERYEIGRIYYYQGLYSNAKEILNGPVEDEYIPALNLMGQVYIAMGDYSHASLMYQTVINKQGESPLAYNNLALCSLAAEDPSLALDYIERGLEMEEEEGKQQLRFNEIVAYEDLNDFSSALVRAEVYCELYPGDLDGYRELVFLRSRG